MYHPVMRGMENSARLVEQNSSPARTMLIHCPFCTELSGKVGVKDPCVNMIEGGGGGGGGVGGGWGVGGWR